MCRVILVLGTLLAIPFGASLDGQTIRPTETTARPTESELVSRIDSLSVILDRAVDVSRVARTARSQEQRRQLTGRIDTVQVGPFLVVAPARQVGLARRYFERAWARYAVIVGTERTPIEGHVFIFGKRELMRGLDADGRSTRVTTRFILAAEGLGFDSKRTPNVSACDRPRSPFRRQTATSRAFCTSPATR